MTTRVLLARHGATKLSAEDRFAGATNVELSEEGAAQATALGKRFGSEKLRAVYVSPMLRATETARLAIAAAGFSVNPGVQVRDALREIDHGRWEGLRKADVQHNFAEEYARWEADPLTFAPEGGESGLVVRDRAVLCVEAIVRAHPEETVAIVSHKATLRLLLCAVLGIDARDYRRKLEQELACLNVLEFNGASNTGARLLRYNDVSHYRPG
jgi:broad specificity phosphatase PhoE